MKAKWGIERNVDKNIHKGKFNKVNINGISLIVLVITIIVIIILATAVIVTLVKNNPIESAIKAVDDSNVSKYTEQIEQIRSKLILQDENYELPKLQELKEALEKEKWVFQTEMIMDEGIEKLKVVTKEGYIFYITEESIEYKGKGGLVDTSALKKEDVIELKAEEETEKGQYVRITNKAEEYYDIKYKIGEEGEYKKIKSGERVEVEYGKTIYARLVYGSSEGIEHKLKIGEKNPSVVAKNIETNNMKRKTEKAFAELFDITWGSEGVGQVRYEVAGNLLFKNKVYSNKSIGNTKELELGTYNVKCIITSESGYEANAVKQVIITNLANTSVTNDAGNSENAVAIYNEYDMVYFRDVVNKVSAKNNAKVMNNISLANVCSNINENWIPIGNSNISYKGIFYGNNKIITNLNIDTAMGYQGLFGKTASSRIQNLTLSGNVKSSNYYIGMLVGYCEKDVIINNCNISSGSVSGGTTIGGVTGYVGNISVQILNCKSNANIDGNMHVAGIVGKNMGIIKYCLNTGKITARSAVAQNYSMVGGIVGENGEHGVTNNNYIFSCANKGDVTGYSYVGGIAGENRSNSYIDYCYSVATIIATTPSGGVNACCGGIVGETYGNVMHSFSKGTVKGNGNYIGGIIGIAVSPITVRNVVGLSNVYRNGVHVGTAAWNNNNSGGLYGSINNINYQNHSYINGQYTTDLSWFTPEFDRIDSINGIPKLSWED